MTITTREVSHVTIVDLNGRITLGDETGQLRDTVRQLIAAGKKKIVLNQQKIAMQTKVWLSQSDDFVIVKFLIISSSPFPTTPSAALLVVESSMLNF